MPNSASGFASRPASESCRTLQRRYGGIVWPPTKATTVRSPTSGVATRTALASCRTMQRRRGGTVSPQTKGTRVRSTTSGVATTKALVSNRTVPRRCGGPDTPQTRGTQVRWLPSRILACGEAQVLQTTHHCYAAVSLHVLCVTVCGAYKVYDGLGLTQINITQSELARGSLSVTIPFALFNGTHIRIGLVYSISQGTVTHRSKDSWRLTTSGTGSRQYAPRTVHAVQSLHRFSSCSIGSDRKAFDLGLKSVWSLCLVFV
jgi:hypothetical protein